MLESETLKLNLRKKKMTNSNNKQAVAVKTQVNAGGHQQNHNETVAVKTSVNAGGGIYSHGINHNETVAVKTRVSAGIIAVL
jgi:hypothetical protein